MPNIRKQSPSAPATGECLRYGYTDDVTFDGYREVYLF